LRNAVLGRGPGKAPPPNDIAEQFQRFELNGGQRKVLGQEGDSCPNYRIENMTDYSAAGSPSITILENRMIQY